MYNHILPKNFKKEYPQFKDFKFWLYNGKMAGQAKIGSEYYGHIYEFDFINKTVIPIIKGG